MDILTNVLQFLKVNPFGKQGKYGQPVKRLVTFLGGLLVILTGLVTAGVVSVQVAAEVGGVIQLLLLVFGGTATYNKATPAYVYNPEDDSTQPNFSDLLAEHAHHENPEALHND